MCRKIKGFVYLDETLQPMNASFLSLSLLALMVLFWVGLVFRITVLRYFKLRRQADETERGRPIQGTVVSVKKSGGRFKAVQMKVEFPNFSQTLVQQEFRFIDSKPEENRYEEGRRVTLLLDESAKGGPTVKLSGGKTVVGRGFILFSAILLAGTLYGSWYLYQRTLFHLQGDWSQADLLFADRDSFLLVGFIFIGVLAFQWGLFRFIKNIGSVKKNVSDNDLKFYGEKTMAQIQKYEDTNVTINDNPKVKFYYRFKDRMGNEHSGEDAIVIGKLEIGLLPSMKEREIFYMPSSPENSKFTENLSPQSLAGCLNGVLLFQAFIFTAILIGIYLSGLS